LHRIFYSIQGIDDKRIKMVWFIRCVIYFGVLYGNMLFLVVQQIPVIHWKPAAKSVYFGRKQGLEVTLFGTHKVCNQPRSLFYFPSQFIRAAVRLDLRTFCLIARRVYPQVNWVLACCLENSF
jgi:hypothetical protein